ncbi:MULTISPECIES: EAL domain-containing protein [unclassified Roseateles]|uniref:EAL domain-containing protein n=1 Tax=unclassified Roseateles TaxID=2626991 RepID=UPI0006FAEF65|nr:MULTISPECIES: EAL domain-containing protein [unclassified Roseateles]KQW51536.1 hypothetical protein ASC81_02550 [Pelomonas sp. Root405]KRA77769.1 hypothetical protein ASD88_02550 [Pelomonas sp. Root662]
MLIVLGAMASIALPIVLSIQLARTQGLDEQLDLARAYAEGLVQRADAAADGIDEAVHTLAAIADTDRCSGAHLAAMRDILVSQSHLQVVGAVSGDAIVCSSLGRTEPIPIGPVSLVTSRGVGIRPSVTLPFARDQQFLVVEAGGFVAVLRKELLLDFTTVAPDVSLALYARSTGATLSARGHLDEDWVKATRNGASLAAPMNGYAVATHASRRYETGAIAAIPLDHAHQRSVRFGMVLVPVGLLAGVCLAGAFLYLSKLRLRPATGIKLALQRREFFMAYQPVVELATGRWIGAEALIRWRRPNGEIVRPDLFIPIAEESGLIVQITQRVMELIGRDANRLFGAFPDFHIAINLSAADLHDIDMPQRLRRLAAKTGAQNSNLIAEVTERAFVQVDRARSVLSELHQFGVDIAIDDFGTGYSSLAHLESLKLDYLKIDKSFVDSLATESVTRHVIDHIIEMAKSLDLKMIAEGVETEAQAQFLREHGVQYAQGWLFGKPIAFRELVDRLKLQSLDPELPCLTAQRP